jgi:hypothetical protein
MEEPERASRTAGVAAGWRSIADRPTLLVSALIVLATASVFTVAVIIWGRSILYLAWDSRAYYDALRSPDPYAGAAVGAIGSFVYPPPFLQVLAPAGELPWPAFVFVWTALLASAAMAMLLRVPWTHRALLPPLVVLAGADIWSGNLNLLIAYAAVQGLTAPAAWALPALTKVTPGIGMLWLAFRGRWRAFGGALLVPFVVATASYLAAPNLWSDWLSVMRGENLAGAYAWSIPVPLLVRLPLALLILWWAARTDRAWMVLIACLVALPVIWFNGLSLLLGAAALAKPLPASAGALGHAASTALSPPERPAGSRRR